MQTAQRKADADSVIKKVLPGILARTLNKRNMTQTEAAWLIKDAPSQISLIVTGKTKGFSSERLLRMVTRLGFDADITIRPSKGKTGKIRVTDQSGM